MSEYHTYEHRSRDGSRKIISNYTGTIEVENAWIERAYVDLLKEMRGVQEDDAEGHRHGVQHQHLLAMIIEEMDREDLIEKAHSMDHEEMAEEYIKPIEDRRYAAQKDPREKLEESVEDMSEEEIADLVEEIEEADN